ARNRAGNQKHVGMTWRRHEMNAEAFDVVDRTAQVHDFDFAAVARPGVHLADMERATQRGIKTFLQLAALRFDAFTFDGSGARAVEQAIVRSIACKAVNRAAYEVVATGRGAFTGVRHPDRRVHVRA